MAFLLDTCTISEPTQKGPNARVISFIRDLPALDGFISTITLVEVWKGIELRPPSKRRTKLEEWFEKDLMLGFDGRILPIDSGVVLRLGSLSASLIRSGWTMPIFDSFIAATALTHNLTLVTRNESDFVHSGCRMLNPWK